MKCLICESKKIVLVAPHIYWCQDCNSFFRDSDIDYSIYNKDYYFDPNWLRLQQRNQSDYFERDVDGSSIIEIGSCWGDLIDCFNYMERCVAFDLRKLLRREYRNNVIEYVDKFENIDKKNLGKFDNVIMNNTIEHINSPSDIFKKVYKILSKKGRFIFITEDADNHLFGLLNMTLHSEHRFIIGRKGVEYLAKKYKFKIIRYDNLFFNNAIYVALEKI